MLVASLLEFSLSVFDVVLRFAVVFLLFGVLCSIFVGVGPFSRDAYMNWARVYLRNAPVHALTPSWVKLKPEVLQKQLGKLTKSMAPSSLRAR